MPRWRQVIDKETGKSNFVRMDEAPKTSKGHFVHGDISSFVSPIDGTVISDRKQYAEHCRKHNVVAAQEFTPEFYERKQKERNREPSREEAWKRKAAIHESWNKLEKGHY